MGTQTAAAPAAAAGVVATAAMTLGWSSEDSLAALGGLELQRPAGEAGAAVRRAREDSSEVACETTRGAGARPAWRLLVRKR